MFNGSVTSDDGTTTAHMASGDGEPVVIIEGATACRTTTPRTRRRPSCSPTSSLQSTPTVAVATGSRAVAERLPTATLKAVPGENHNTTAGVLAPVLHELIKEN